MSIIELVSITIVAYFIGTLIGYAIEYMLIKNDI